MSRILFTLLLLGGATLTAESVSWQTLVYPPAVTKTYCYGINNAGDMVGGAAGRAFLVSDGLYYDVSPADASSSVAWGINARGDIVGDFWVGTTEHGFLLRKGHFIQIDFPGQAMTHPRDINARGDIVGGFMPTSTSVQHGFILKKGDPPEAYTEVVKEGATYTMVFGINDEGELAGEFKDGTGIHGFLRTKDGEFITLDAPNAMTTSAWKVNSRHEIAGYYWDRNQPSISHGFTWRQGRFQNDDFPGAVHTMDHGLNNEGDTCGMMSFTPLGATPAWGGFGRVRQEDN